MSRFDFYLLVISVALLTYMTRRILLRFSFQLSKRLQSGLDTIPLGIFSAIIFPSVFISDSNHITFNPALLIGCVICLVIMWRTSNVLLSILISMGLVMLVDVHWL